jgi:hypothetical protein
MTPVHITNDTPIVTIRPTTTVSGVIIESKETRNISTDTIWAKPGRRDKAAITNTEPTITQVTTNTPNAIPDVTVAILLNEENNNNILQDAVELERNKNTFPGSHVAGAYGDIASNGEGYSDIEEKYVNTQGITFQKRNEIEGTISILLYISFLS